MAVEIDVKNECDTDILGSILAKNLPNNTVIALLGTLGAGKTRLVQGVAQALGIPKEKVSSPTFVLIKEYEGTNRLLYHFDAYRLRDSDEFLALGPDEYFDSDGLSFVEWADRVEDVMPRDYLEISILPLGKTARRFTLKVKGNFDNKIVETIYEHWQRAYHPISK